MPIGLYHLRQDEEKGEIPNNKQQIPNNIET
jgi:hypothetical protein